MRHYILQFYNYDSILPILMIHCWYQTTPVYSTSDLSSGFDRRTTTVNELHLLPLTGGSMINSGGLGVVGRSS